jgi:hypothetical protein
MHRQADCVLQSADNFLQSEYSYCKSSIPLAPIILRSYSGMVYCWLIRREAKCVWLIKSIFITTTLACGAGYALAQDSDNLLAGVRICMTITDNTTRLACFDALATDASAPVTQAQPISAAPGVSASTTTPVRTAPAVAESKQTEIENTETEHTESEKTVATVANFGTTNTRVENNSAGQVELLDRVAALAEREPGKLLITLESGQVWYQVNSERFHLRKGMEIRVYPAPMGGSYRLSADEIRGFIQVQRVR